MVFYEKVTTTTANWQGYHSNEFICYWDIHICENENELNSVHLHCE